MKDDEDFSEYADIIKEANGEGFEFKLKKPLTPSGEGKRYYPGILIDTLELAEATIEREKDTPPIKRRQRPKSKWKPKRGTKYLSAEQVLEATDIVELISRYTQLRPSGKDQRGKCPLHGSRQTSLKVDPSKQLFHCFGCLKGGNAINFVMEAEGLDFKNAIKFLAERFNVKE